MAKEKITKELTFSEVLTKYPKTAEVIMRRGLHCIGCHAAAHETIAQGCEAHGLSEQDIEDLVKDMNKVVSKK